MHGILFIECAARGLLTINGQFCGPLDEEGQAFPLGKNAEVYMEFLPLEEHAVPMVLEMQMESGNITRLEPKAHGFALLWPDGIIQLELRPDSAGEPAREAENVASGVLLRYLSRRLSGDPQAAGLLLHPERPMPLPEYDVVVPLRFAPLHAPERFDERAGLVRRLSDNVARVDAALAVTVPAGQGRRLIERIEVLESVE